MADIESPEAFAERICDGWVLDGKTSLADVIASLIRARDAAVRREALQGVADWCEAEAARYDWSGPEAWSNALRNAAAYWLQRALDEGGSGG